MPWSAAGFVLSEEDALDLKIKMETGIGCAVLGNQASLIYALLIFYLDHREALGK
jgi:hypothetical protein